MLLELGFEEVYGGRHPWEFTLKHARGLELYQKTLRAGFLFGYKDALLLAVTEKRTKQKNGHAFGCYSLGFSTSLGGSSDGFAKRKPWKRSTFSLRNSSSSVVSTPSAKTFIPFLLHIPTRAFITSCLR